MQTYYLQKYVGFFSLCFFLYILRIRRRLVFCGGGPNRTPHAGGRQFLIYGQAAHIGMEMFKTFVRKINNFGFCLFISQY